ncbi:MAG: hypothetical protein AAGI15_03675 [Pseudomonadota bacterium]
MTRKLNNAKALYLEGIRDGKVREAVTRYTGARYTQHSTGVADGVEGFVAFFTDFVARCPVREIEIVRGFEDGQHVFVQAYQNINQGEARWLTMDLFDTDEDDRIIEHWDVISAVTDESVSGHSQFDGPTAITDLERTDANKALIQAYVETVLLGGHFSEAPRFISGDQLTQHNPFIADGLDGLARYTESLAADGRPLRYTHLFKLIGQGNFVVTYAGMSLGQEDYAVFDLYRIEEGKIVEHWDNLEPIPPRDTWANSGKF